MRVAVITSGYMPVPNVLGGAVEALVMQVVRMNEIIANLDLHIFSIYDEAAVPIANQFTKTRFSFIRVPRILQQLDRAVYEVARVLPGISKPTSFRFILQRLWFLKVVQMRLAKSSFDRVVLENHVTLFSVIKSKSLRAKYHDKIVFHVHNEVGRLFGVSKELSSLRTVMGVSRFINSTLGLPFQRPGLSRVVLRNAVDLEAFEGVDSCDRVEGWRAKWGASPDHTVFLFSGRLTAEKGARELVEAFLRADIDKGLLIIAGGLFFGSDMTSGFEESLRAVVLKYPDRIILTGYIPHEEMPSVYKAADICCLPSIWEDPAPLAVIEAMAASKPLITTRSGGIPEYASEDCAFLLERSASLVDEISSAMRILVGDSDLREAMARNARSRSRELGLERFYSDYVRLLSG